MLILNLNPIRPNGHVYKLFCTANCIDLSVLAACAYNRSLADAQADGAAAAAAMPQSQRNQKAGQKANLLAWPILAQIKTQQFFASFYKLISCEAAHFTSI